MTLTLSLGFGMTETIRLPIIMAIPEQDVTIPKTDEPAFGFGSTYPGSVASKADATRFTPDINNISVRMRGVSFKNARPSFARSSTRSPCTLPVSGILIKNSNAVNAIRKLPISTAITPFKPVNEYNAVAAKGFSMDMSDLDRERNPLVFW